MTRNEYRFIELAKCFLFGANPRIDDKITCLDCLDCILSCPEDMTFNWLTGQARYFAHSFVHYFYEKPGGIGLPVHTKDFIDNWKKENGVK